MFEYEHKVAGDTLMISAGRMPTLANEASVDLPLTQERSDVLLERLHSELAARGHGVLELMRFRIANQIAHCIGPNQHFDRRTAPVSRAAPHQMLAHHRRQNAGELSPDQRLRSARESVDDAIDGLRRVPGMHRRQDEMAGLGRGQRTLHRLRAAHLTDDDHVRIGTQRA